ncbi:unnamed protein product [Lactuca saligna]|uniref:Uncharacterized protein n=1 Tax=Lactuca saligna TaxID=75948 RepID=A0AA35ZEP9_LACSI|nr:unnamed protein product [Lactuca saligna]
MNTQCGNDQDNDALIGKAQIARYLFGTFDAMAIRCCIELGIPDIINNHNRPTTLSEIATGINSSSVNLDGLGRLMKFLVHRKMFDEIPQKDDGEGETVYSLNHYSNWLVSHTNVTMAPLVMFFTDPFMLSPLRNLSRSIKEGDSAFKITHGDDIFDFSLINSEFNKMFNEAMACTTKFTLDVIISNYKNGFLGMKGSVVDVGGGTGVAISEIVKAYPHLKGINFDLPQVISNAPKYDGVTHVAGDMFKVIPPAETIFMKWILHNWSNDDCVKILKNCRKAIPTDIGKVIIVEIVQQYSGQHDLLNDVRVPFDLTMFAYFSRGRERTEGEWKKLLEEGGFQRYKIIYIPEIVSIIEAFPI